MLAQVRIGALDSFQRVLFTVRQPDAAPAVGERSRDRLLDPPRRVRAESNVSAIVELGGGLQQTEISILNQIEQRGIVRYVALGDLDHQAKVAFDQGLPGFHVTGLDTSR